MSENIIVQGTTKQEKYDSLIPQIKGLVESEPNQSPYPLSLTPYPLPLIPYPSYVLSAIKYGMNFFWVGLYIVKDKELFLGPFQGPVACTRIGYGKGVCGSAWKDKKTIIVDDVNTFEGHIACSSESKSEIAIPIFNPHPPKGMEDEVIMILDVDSEHYSNFDSTDEAGLLEIMKILFSHA